MSVAIWRLGQLTISLIRRNSPKVGSLQDLDRRRRLWRWSIFLLRRLQFEEQLPALGGYEATVGKGIDDAFDAPDVTGVG